MFLATADSNDKRYAMDVQVSSGSESVASARGTLHIPVRPDMFPLGICNLKLLDERRGANDISGVGLTHSSDETRESGWSEGGSGRSLSMLKHYWHKRLNKVEQYALKCSSFQGANDRSRSRMP